VPGPELELVLEQGLESDGLVAAGSSVGLGLGLGSALVNGWVDQEAGDGSAPGSVVEKMELMMEVEGVVEGSASGAEQGVGAELGSGVDKGVELGNVGLDCGTAVGSASFRYKVSPSELGFGVFQGVRGQLALRGSTLRIGVVGSPEPLWLWSARGVELSLVWVVAPTESFDEVCLAWRSGDEFWTSTPEWSGLLEERPVDLVLIDGKCPASGHPQVACWSEPWY
jgi:hypothetical protein